MKRPVIILITALFFLSLSSCLSVESELTLKDDGSGILKLSYRVSRIVQEIGQVDSENTLIPLPVKEEDFLRIVEENPDLSLRSFSLNSDDEYIYVEAELDFANPQALDLLMGGASGETVSFSRDNGGGRFSQVIYTGLGGEMSVESKQLLETYFTQDSVTCSVKTESPIKSSTLGSIESGGKTAVYTSSIVDIVQSMEPVIFTVEW